MAYYPVQLDIDGRPCLVVGGGSVGVRKVEGLLACGARVTVVSPELDPVLEALAARGRIEARQRGFSPRDLDGMFLVIGATDDEAVNRVVSEAAEAKNLLVNIADQPEKCNFILPSVIRQGDLVVSFSTSGKSPAFARRLRKDLTARFGPEYALFLEILGAARKRLLAQEHAPEEHKPLFEKLVYGPLLERLGDNDQAGADEILLEVLGPDFTVAGLLGRDLAGPGK
ncbi:MAG: bifunctional precorrin-2 dehydrogenase/sirohydrochlorin ferrochelatase [Proteobacteria bacterium]|nr:bifunctional precorrin-2 dehydrogenase/sirohydrochlorin ferrochelatase [Pseudomonadota bacterium]